MNHALSLSPYCPLPLFLFPSLSLSLSPSTSLPISRLPPSLPTAPSVPLSLSPSTSLPTAPSVPLSLSPSTSLPISLCPSLPLSLSPSVPLSLSPALLSSLRSLLNSLTERVYQFTVTPLLQQLFITIQQSIHQTSRDLQQFLCVCLCVCVYVCAYVHHYSGTSDNGHSQKKTTSVERTNCFSPTDCTVMYLHSVPSDIGTTSLQWTRGLSPLCPLFKGIIKNKNHKKINFHCIIMFYIQNYDNVQAMY